MKDEVGKKVRGAIERVLRERLGPYGFRDATVRAGVGHDGDSVLFVVAHFNLVPEPIDPAITVGIIEALRDGLEDIGDARFPHVNYDFHDDQTLVEKKRKRQKA